MTFLVQFFATIDGLIQYLLGLYIVPFEFADIL